MSAGTRANYQKKGILNFAMQPDNPRQATENFSLTTLF
jgi:hypothetical protein